METGMKNKNHKIVKTISLLIINSFLKKNKKISMK